MNIGKINSVVFDEIYTPTNATLPLIKYIPKGIKTIWCPCDTLESNIVKELVASGYEVIISHKDEGKNFFEWQPEQFDMIITNPPYSIKDAIIARCLSFGKPWALLLPLDALCGGKRNDLYENNPVGVVSFAERLNFTGGKGNWFYSIWICCWEQMANRWYKERYKG